jgi:hypothetical protein
MTIPHAILSIAEGNCPIPNATYYEVCMASSEPLTGAHTAECADLREELEFVRKSSSSSRAAGSRRSRANFPLANYSHLDGNSWLELPVGFNLRNWR